MTSLAMRAPARLQLRRRTLVALAILFPVAGVGAYAGTNVWTSLAQKSLRARWDQLVAQGPVSPVVLSTRGVAIGDPVARLVIPVIDVDVIATHGGNLRRAPVHVVASALPGLDGITIIRGGRFGFGNHFMNLSQLAPGDRIGIQTLGGALSLIVRSVETGPVRAIDPSQDAPSPVLILIAPARTFGTDQVVVRAEAATRENRG